MSVGYNNRHTGNMSLKQIELLHVVRFTNCQSFVVESERTT